jgi:hypothetical protein
MHIPLIDLRDLTHYVKERVRYQGVAGLRALPVADAITAVLAPLRQYKLLLHFRQSRNSVNDWAAGEV